MELVPFMLNAAAIFVFSIQFTVNKCSIKFLPKTGIEPQISGVESDRSAN